MIPDRFRFLVEETRDISDLFSKNGKTLFLVGGAVRDAILKPSFSKVKKDLDFTTDASPDEIETILRTVTKTIWTQGKRFGTIGCLYKGRNYEITTHRAEAYSYESRNPDVVFSQTIKSDLSRRDFTINAMALKLPELELIDPFDGITDLSNKVLRTPLSAEESFSDDPLRMLRAARFIAAYDLEPTLEVVEAATKLARRMKIVSPERIRTELDQLLVLDSPSKGLWFLVNTKVSDYFIPELSALALQQDPIHKHKDVLAHSIAVVEKASPRRRLRLAALFHDIGKPKTRSIGPEGVSFHHHEVVGARMTKERMKALSYSNEDIEIVSELVRMHLRFHTYQMGWTDRAVRRYVRDAGDLLEDLNELTRCDSTTRNKTKAAALARRMDELETRIAELEEKEELNAIRPELNGSQIMEILNLSPGPDVGKALAFLLNLRLDEGILGYEVVRQRLIDWWKLQR